MERRESIFFCESDSEVLESDPGPRLLSDDYVQLGDCGEPVPLNWDRAASRMYLARSGCRKSIFCSSAEFCRLPLATGLPQLLSVVTGVHFVGRDASVRPVLTRQIPQASQIRRFLQVNLNLVREARRAGIQRRVPNGVRVPVDGVSLLNTDASLSTRTTRAPRLCIAVFLIVKSRSNRFSSSSAAGLKASDAA